MNHLRNGRMTGTANGGVANGAGYGAGYGAAGRGAPGRAPCALASPGPLGAARAPLVPKPGQAGGHGATNGAALGAAHGALIDAETVIYRLEEGGMTLLALPNAGYSTRLRTGGLEIVRTVAESYGWTEGRVRPPVPSAAKITRMDEALGWIALIPGDRVALRRIVGARSLVSPVTERHVYSWRRVAMAVGADHKAVQRWHAQGIDLIVAALRR